MQGKPDQSSSMALSGTQYSSRMSDYSDVSDSDDSRDDPTFDILDETRSSFSSLSVQRKPKSRIGLEKDGDIEEEPSVVQMVVPELDEKDKKNYDIVQKAIEDGCIQSLKLDQCKIYLRKHGLRLTGTKDILIRRIKEHLEFVNGGGEKKYPPSSFVVNCQGDACTGDVVLFEQNVYEMFSIVSHSASGPPSGTRVIAGRIVKESYGAAKQQHTFTIEVLWSRGEKPLPPLHPLLIKGRNLYRLRTMRQKWEDEGERQRILAEKHARGYVARSKREVRVQQKELRNMLKSKRVVEPKVSRNPLPVSSINMENQFQKQREQMQDNNSQNQCLPNVSLTRNMPFDRLHVQRQPFTSMNNSFLMGPWGMPGFEHYIKPKQHSTSSGQPGFGNVGPGNHNRSNSDTKELCSAPLRFAYQEGLNKENLMKSSFQGHIASSVQQHFYPGNPNMNPPYVGDRAPGPRPESNRKLCRYYAQGRCHYGQNCKYLH